MNGSESFVPSFGSVIEDLKNAARITTRMSRERIPVPLFPDYSQFLHVIYPRQLAAGMRLWWTDKNQNKEQS